MYNKQCTIVGGGKVAERKVSNLLEYGARIKVISPSLTEELKKWKESGCIAVEEREYRHGDLSDSAYVFVAVDRPEISRLCTQEGAALGILMNVADQPDQCDFIVPAVVTRGELTLAISTNGKSPLLSRKIREELENTYDEVYGLYVDILGEIRKAVITEVTDPKKRKKVFERIIYSDLLQKYQQGVISDLKQAIFDLYRETMNDMNRE
ncbi:MAG: precorrin-2 dehydrogenase/sirohydrochlorin ferrochelatase family protein [Bacillota bacterium]